MRQQHGSGKTAVLVERIINKVINENVDIDKILVVTFTNAAASEMRERILDAIYKKLEENPDSVNLQRQINLLNKASICTIHSFCLDVIRNNFYEIDTSANFRIGDTSEIEMLKSDVLEKIFEQKYMDNDEDFLTLLEAYTDYKDDGKLQKIILNIYKYIQSNPFPKKWLKDKVEEFNIDVEEDFAKTVWGRIILDNVREKVENLVIQLEKAKKDTLKFSELEKVSSLLQDNINNLNSINYESWDLAYETMRNVSWGRWPNVKNIDLELKDITQKVRDDVKEDYKKIILQYTSREANEDIYAMYGILSKLRNLILEFFSKFAIEKKEKNIIDFNDIEHFALKILVKEDGQKTEVAKKYTNKFEEILIDEYQDSNLVQEKILTSISRGNNIFMVGDVKQSIYKFRQARPELFLEKYEKYDMKSNLNENSKGLKIQLFKNFRSRESVLDITNLVFENIMSKKLGDVEYNKEEYLNYGANYPKPEEKINYAGIAELHIIDLKEKEEDYFVANQEDELQQEEQEENEEERIEDTVLEARFVAKKIQEMLQSDYQVFDKKRGYRKIMAKDICVLLRATTAYAPIYEKEISELNIPVFSDSSSTYLESMEVQTIMALLKVIDNPMQDIPLVTILRSNIFGFTDNDLIQIRLKDRTCSFYESMIKAKLSVNNELRAKIEYAISEIEKWKEEEKYIPLNEFIWHIYLDTGFYDYVKLLPNGNLRQANLKLLFEKAKQYEKASFKGLYNFITFIDKVNTNSGDATSAKIIGENDNVVRIMSIHKSKGLEFPVVILARAGKQFNMQDLKGPILLHQDIGFGVKFIDTKEKIEYNTLTREAIKIKYEIENFSEEMRVLYVALTRAKEKLIITGMSKDLEKDLKDKRQILEIYKNKEYQNSLEEPQGLEMTISKINKNAVQRYMSYLDWIELVYEYNKEKGIKNIIELRTYEKEELIKQIKKEENEIVDIEKNIREKAKEVSTTEKAKEDEKKIEKILKWKYKNIASSRIPTKTSVTKLKEMEADKDIDDLIKMARKKVNDNNFKEKKEELLYGERIINNVEHKKDEELNSGLSNEENSILTAKPKFLEKVQTLTAAQKGTLMHLCVQKLDEKKEYTKDDLKEFIKNLQDKHIISEKEANSISVDLLLKYTKSELWQELKQAQEIHKEEPFYIQIPAQEIYDEASEDEMILVQGMIDLYYIDKDGKLILVDYKTDYVPDGDVSKLEEKYRVQLNLYKRALEGALGRNVDKAMIWALRK